MKNCTNCHASYEPYVAGADSDRFGSWCELPVTVWDEAGQAFMQEPSGVCSFCNPKGIFYTEERAERFAAKSGL